MDPGIAAIIAAIIGGIFLLLSNLIKSKDEREIQRPPKVNSSGRNITNQENYSVNRSVNNYPQQQNIKKNTFQQVVPTSLNDRLKSLLLHEAAKQLTSLNTASTNNAGSTMLERQPFETEEKYRIRLLQTFQNPIIAGKATLVDKEYHIKTQRFQLIVEWEEWFKLYNVPIKDVFIEVNEVIAEELYRAMKNPYPVFAALNVGAGNISIQLPSIEIGLNALYLCTIDNIFTVYQMTDRIAYEVAIRQNTILAYNYYLFQSPDILKQYAYDVEQRLLDETCWLYIQNKKDLFYHIEYVTGKINSNIKLKFSHKHSTNKLRFHEEEALSAIDEICWEYATKNDLRKCYIHYLNLNHSSPTKRVEALSEFYIYIQFNKIEFKTPEGKDLLLPLVHTEEAFQALKSIRAKSLMDLLSVFISLILIPFIVGNVSGGLRVLAFLVGAVFLCWKRPKRLKEYLIDFSETRIFTILGLTCLGLFWGALAWGGAKSSGVSNSEALVAAISMGIIGIFIILAIMKFDS